MRVLPNSEHALHGTTGHAKLPGDGLNGFPGLLEDEDSVPVEHPGWSAEPRPLGPCPAKPWNRPSIGLNRF